MIDVKIVLEDGGIMPTKATDGSAAYDVYCPEDFEIRKGRNVVPLNFKLQLPYGYGVDVRSRSGFTLKGFEGKDGLRYDADVKLGLVDCDYRGTLGVLVKSDCDFFIGKGTRIAQITFQKFEDADFDLVDELDDTPRGEGGFGHSGTREV